MFKIETNFDELEENLNELAKKAEELNNEEFTVHLTDEGVIKHTNCSSLEELYNLSGVLESDDDETAISKIDSYLKNQPIGSFEELMGAIGEDFILDQLK
ncbi:hypothetical protein [uncultured Ilyobacter sp.]|uniref:hypothetical protein n=1 Tax=uncultured Ilyobacter sp. TaxID=544433 RepID=UPI0029C858D9|nr:hypothetical protein [uncultured Ilyobacter sp.]